MRTTKTLIRLRGCAGSIKSSLDACVRRYVFSRCGSNICVCIQDVIQIEDSWQRQTREQAATVARLQQENTQLKTSLTQKEKALKG